MKKANKIALGILITTIIYVSTLFINQCSFNEIDSTKMFTSCFGFVRCTNASEPTYALVDKLAVKYDFCPRQTSNNAFGLVNVSSYIFDRVFEKQLNAEVQKYKDMLDEYENDTTEQTIENITKVIRNNFVYDESYLELGCISFGNFHTLRSLRDGRGVCSDISYIVKELCDYKGIECRYVNSIIMDGAHVLNEYKADDGTWYVIDETNYDVLADQYYKYMTIDQVWYLNEYTHF